MSVIRDIFGFFNISTNPGMSVMRTCAACCQNTEDNGWSSTAESEADDS